MPENEYNWTTPGVDMREEIHDSADMDTVTTNFDNDPKKPTDGPKEWLSEQQWKEDNVNHPSHYTWLKDIAGVEVIDITRWMDFDLGNAIKYILRCGRKDPSKRVEDLKKAIWYIQDEIKLMEKEDENSKK